MAEREQVLRTRAMREREEMRAVVRHYRYTLLRVRMPDGLLLQGRYQCCLAKQVICHRMFPTRLVRIWVYDHVTDLFNSVFGT